ncbi:hypothetical protein, partial [Rhodopseudomonas sp. B29]|uniref:hypothetical protein n=1 Tax=Rhodopseudomonas sp. B29 TaxID=95607 RepID=UPI001AEBE365
LTDEPGRYHFDFEFHCTDCGGYQLRVPEEGKGKVKCSACGCELGSLASINERCRRIAVRELKARGLGAFFKG